MKQYHTVIEINSPAEIVWKHLVDFGAYPEWNPLVGSLTGELIKGAQISTYIIPLGKTYKPTVLTIEPNSEITWQGIQGAKWLLAGKHYYRLEKIDVNKTKLLHGEWFTGLLSWFIRRKLLNKMENAFLSHNQLLKQRIEDEK